MENQEEDEVRFTLRLSRTTYEALKRLAKREDRSVHAQTVRMIRNNRDLRQELEREHAGVR